MGYAIVKTVTEVDELLKKRLATPKGDWWRHGLRLRSDDALTATGWAVREVKAVELHRDMPMGEKLDKLRAHWLDEWVRKDEDAQRKRWELEAEKALAKARACWAQYGPPGIYRRIDRDSYRVTTEEQRTALDKVMNFPYADEESDSTAFSNLALLGTPGTGKTHLAALWLREQVFEQGYEGRFITSVQLVREVRRAWNERGVDETEVLERFGSVGVLVIDDIGVDTNEGAIKTVVEVFDLRLANGLHTCFTSNLTATELREAYGPRGYSRLFANAQVVVLTGVDMRLNCRQKQ